MQLFLFPFAGGSARSFRDLAGSLSGCCSPVPCDTPTSNRLFFDAPEALTIRQMAARQATRLASIRQPFAIFGHSMGALVAFETARRLRRMGAVLPSVIILSAHRAPHLPPERAPLSQLPDSEFDRRLADYSGTPRAVLQDAETMDLFRRLLRRDFAACESYRMQDEPPLDIPALCLGGNEDPDVAPEHLSAWSDHFTMPVGLGMLPGGHFYFAKADAGQAVANHIKSALRQLPVIQARAA